MNDVLFKCIELNLFMVILGYMKYIRYRLDMFGLGKFYGILLINFVVNEDDFVR